MRVPQISYNPVRLRWQKTLTHLWDLYSRCYANFVVGKGDGRTPLGRGMAMDLHILRIGPVQANSVSGGLDGDIWGRYSALFNGVGLLKG